MTHEMKVATEVAEGEFARWLEAMDLSHKADIDGMDKDDLASFTKAKRVLIRAMERGLLFVTDNALEFTPQLGDTSKITFPEPKGSTLLAADKYKEGENMHKLYGCLADLTGLPPKRFSAMQRRDIAVCEAVFGLFFG